LYQETVPAPGTIYEGVFKLLPGQRVVIDGADALADFYWQLDYDDAHECSAGALADELRDLLGKCVARTVTADTVGTFLSGGTDSSAIAGVLTQ
jgi:asparagine synthase (glutamine-hydrolysing)